LVLVDGTALAWVFRMALAGGACGAAFVPAVPVLADTMPASAAVVIAAP